MVLLLLLFCGLLVLGPVPLFVVGETINCPSTGVCDQSVLDCAENEECIVNCLVEDSCSGTTINCPSSASCTLNCEMFFSCLDATLNCPTDSTSSCTINAQEETFGGTVNAQSAGLFESFSTEQIPLTFSTVNCPSGAGNVCRFNAGDDLLEEAQIFGGIGGNVEFITNPKFSLEDSVVDATQSATLSFAGGAQTGEVYCPVNGQCILDGKNGESFRGLLLFTPNGLDDVDISIVQGTADDGDFRSFTVNCGLNYADSCTARYTESTDTWQCDPVTSPCARTVTSEPTAVPTRTPTDRPSTSPTNVPSGVPSDVPTKSPTDRPTLVPTTQPTTEPTTNPTKVPTMDPTNVPSTVPTKGPTDVPTIEPTRMPTFVPTLQPTEDVCDSKTGLCESYRCSDASVDNNEFCLDQQPWGCPTCADGTFKRSLDHLCLPCETIRGCNTCKDYTGCSECRDGFTAAWGNPCGLRVCVPDSCPDEIQKCGSNQCQNPGENPDCVDLQSWGCEQCKDGYFFKNHDFPCVACSIIDGCVECDNWKGCIKCEDGLSLVQSPGCGIGVCY